MNPSLNDSMRGRRLGEHGHVLFDRLDTEPPRYLTVLRAAGSRRRFISHPALDHYPWFKGAVFSTAVNNVTRLGLQFPRDGVFLDAGCGNSPDADLIGHLGMAADKAVKIDLFPVTPDEYHPDYSTARFIQGDICKLSDYLPTGSVDMIGCSAVLDLMDVIDRNLFYNEAFAVMRPGGIMTISYAWLVHGYHDWGWRDYRNAQDVGFEVLDFKPHATLIVRKPQ